MKNTLVVLLLLLINHSCREAIEYAYPKVKIDSYQACTGFDIAPNKGYKDYCECAEENNLTFPTQGAEYGKLMINNSEFGDPFQFDNKYYPLDQQFINELRTIVSDSSNFKWGELGTQHPCYVLEFFNSSDELINRADITCGGMLNLQPSLWTIKWGHMNHQADSLMSALIIEYEKNAVEVN